MTKRSTLGICGAVLVLLGALLLWFTSGGSSKRALLPGDDKWHTGSIEINGKKHEFQYRRYSEPVDCGPPHKFSWPNERLDVSPKNTVLTVLSWDAACKTEAAASGCVNPEKARSIFEADHKMKKAKAPGYDKWVRRVLLGEIRRDDETALVISALYHFKSPDKPRYECMEIVKRGDKFLLVIDAESDDVQAALSYDNYSCVTGAKHKRDEE